MYVYVWAVYLDNQRVATFKLRQQNKDRNPDEVLAAHVDDSGPGRYVFVSVEEVSNGS